VALLPDAIGGKINGNHLPCLRGVEVPARISNGGSTLADPGSRERDPERLPPLDLLAAFEAVARHRSFTRAGAERFITQSAISRQIRTLEEHLGTTLLDRSHRTLTLTDEGRRLHETCTTILAAVRTTVGDIRTARKRPVLSITTTPAFALMWLVPRLPSFTRAHPEVDVRIDSGIGLHDLKAGAFDLAIRYGRADTPLGKLLFQEDIVPVCSPALAQDDSRPLKAPSDLRAHTLLQVEVPPGSTVPLEWDSWLAEHRVAGLRPSATLSFSNYDHAIAAALCGQGVVLGRLQLIEQLLRHGKLVAPLGSPRTSQRAHYVAVAPESAAKPQVEDFEHWLLDRATRQAARIDANSGLPAHDRSRESATSS
jgi:DNA-binding transcriptional LysR family regulator